MVEANRSGLLMHTVYGKMALFVLWFSDVTQQNGTGKVKIVYTSSTCKCLQRELPGYFLASILRYKCRFLASPVS